MGKYLNLQIISLSRCTGRVAQLADEEKIEPGQHRKDGIFVADWRSRPTPGAGRQREKSWLLKEADRLRTQRMLTSLGAGSSSITSACEFISGLWGGMLSRSLSACSYVEGTSLGSHSELNHRTVETDKKIKTNRTLHGRVFKSSKSSNLLSLSRLLCACSHVEGTCLGTHSELNPRTIVTY